MATSALNALLEPARRYGQAMLAAHSEPHAELLALVWGPRFDRVHAQHLLADPALGGGMVFKTVMDAADQFDRLPQAQQQRVRRLIARHHRRWDNAACTASC